MEKFFCKVGDIVFNVSGIVFGGIALSWEFLFLVSILYDNEFLKKPFDENFGAFVFYIIIFALFSIVSYRLSDYFNNKCEDIDKENRFILE